MPGCSTLRKPVASCIRSATADPAAIECGLRANVTDHTMSNASDSGPGGRQLLHLVFGGELEQLDTISFRDLDRLDIVGVFPNYAAAHRAWKAKAQQTVDNAHMRYFIVHLHRLLDPDGDGKFG